MKLQARFESYSFKSEDSKGKALEVELTVLDPENFELKVDGNTLMLSELLASAGYTITQAKKPRAKRGSKAKENGAATPATLAAPAVSTTASAKPIAAS